MFFRTLFFFFLNSSDKSMMWSRFLFLSSVFSHALVLFFFLVLAHSSPSIPHPPLFHANALFCISHTNNWLLHLFAFSLALSLWLNKNLSIIVQALKRFSGTESSERRSEPLQRKHPFLSSCYLKCTAVIHFLSLDLHYIPLMSFVPGMYANLAQIASGLKAHHRTIHTGFRITWRQSLASQISVSE